MGLVQPVAYQIACFSQMRDNELVPEYGNGRLLVETVQDFLKGKGFIAGIFRNNLTIITDEEHLLLLAMSDLPLINLLVIRLTRFEAGNPQYHWYLTGIGFKIQMQRQLLGNFSPELFGLPEDLIGYADVAQWNKHNL